jgi:hypothetical protein
MSRKVPSRCIFFLSTRRPIDVVIAHEDLHDQCLSKGLCSALTSAGNVEPADRAPARRLDPACRRLTAGGLALVTAFDFEAHALAFVQATHPERSTAVMCTSTSFDPSSG